MVMWARARAGQHPWHVSRVARGELWLLNNAWFIMVTFIVEGPSVKMWWLPAVKWPISEETHSCTRWPGPWLWWRARGGWRYWRRRRWEAATGDGSAQTEGDRVAGHSTHQVPGVFRYIDTVDTVSTYIYFLIQYLVARFLAARAAQ